MCEMAISRNNNMGIELKPIIIRQFFFSHLNFFEKKSRNKFNYLVRGVK